MADNALLPLLSALTMAFALIVLGYVGAATKFISPSAASGIGQLCGKVSLPILVFHGVATADLSTVNLNVVVVALLAKYHFALPLIYAASPSFATSC